MPENNRESNAEQTKPPRSRARFAALIGIALVIVIVAAVLGIKTARWITQRRAVAEEGRRVDEYLGLGARTGMTGDLELQVNPLSLTIRSGQPAKVRLALINHTRKAMRLNSWLTPAPSFFDSNQFPFRIKMSAAGRAVTYNGGVSLPPPHTRKDFFVLRPGEARTIEMDVSHGPEGGVWDISRPGVYAAEIWYQTYVTGRWIGVNAWTGMTNHVIVRITVTR